MRHLLCNPEGSLVGYYDTSRRAGGLLSKVQHKSSSALQPVFVIAYWGRCDSDTNNTRMSHTTRLNGGHEYVKACLCRRPGAHGWPWRDASQTRRPCPGAARARPRYPTDPEGCLSGRLESPQC